MKKIIIFGASEAGRNYIKNQSDFSILAIADNDLNKIGKDFEGLKVINPSEILNHQVDKIVITSMYFNPIKNQLIELGIDELKILAPPKRLLKSNTYPFNDKATSEFSHNLIHQFTETLDNLGIKCILDFGTLLGVVRENQLIKWDDDIDFSILREDAPKLFDNVKELIGSLSTTVKWSYKYIYTLNEEVERIVFSFEEIGESKFIPFTIDICIVDFYGDYAIHTMDKCNKIHFENLEILQFNGHKVYVPYRYKVYLEHIYGDWELPNKETSFADYSYAY